MGERHYPLDTIHQHQRLDCRCYTTQSSQDIRPVLGVPENRYVVAVIVAGYGAEKPSPRPRRRLEELFYLEKWGAV